MALKKKPVTGMKDILPAEMAIRDYVIRLIKETYGTFVFSTLFARQVFDMLHAWSLDR